MLPSMGPPPFGDGNLYACGATPGDGNDHQAMETRALHDVPSMGPPPFGDGNFESNAPVSSHPLPSMGPPPFGDGNSDWRWSELSLHYVPSMGPPPFGDGNQRCGQGDGGAPAFNGATAFRRWKLSKWGHRLSAMETVGRPPCMQRSFNGATAFRRWKHGKPPSMGPPPFGDGNSARQPFLQWGHRLSAMATGMLILAMETTSSQANLQWGHRLSAMETWLPPPFGDGNL